MFYISCKPSYKKTRYFRIKNSSRNSDTYTNRSILDINARCFVFSVEANERGRKLLRPGVPGKSGRYAETSTFVRAIVQIVDQRHEDNQSTFVRIAAVIQ